MKFKTIKEYQTIESAANMAGVSRALVYQLVMKGSFSKADIGIVGNKVIVLKTPAVKSWIKERKKNAKR